MRLTRPPLSPPCAAHRQSWSARFATGREIRPSLHERKGARPVPPALGRIFQGSLFPAFPLLYPQCSTVQLPLDRTLAVRSSTHLLMCCYTLFQQILE